MKRILSFLCFGIAFVAEMPHGQTNPLPAVDRSAFSCRVSGLPVSVALENPPVEIQRVRYVDNEGGTSWPDFSFRNLVPTPIQGLALIMEYIGEDGQTIDRIPFIGVTQSAEKGFHPPFVAEYVDVWKAPVPPEQVALVGSYKNGIRTGSCPRQARVTFIMIQVADGAVQTFSSSVWQLGPMPRYIPDDFDFPQHLFNPPLALMAKVKISGSGRVVDVVSEDQEHPEVLGLIRDQMRQNWTFNPGLYNGQPTESDLAVLFHIHAERTAAFPEAKPLLSPVTLIELFPRTDRPGRWEIAFGRRFGGTLVEWRP